MTPSANADGLESNLQESENNPSNRRGLQNSQCCSSENIIGLLHKAKTFCSLSLHWKIYLVVFVLSLKYFSRIVRI